ncbi:S8 family serine peptidase [Luteimonas sp. MC1572]|nr:S8 family serine peptidase [Luteimonas sp. MC1572]QQO02565.1 S8 family serine peptidase [Luteimonas sp. MC1572]
MTDRPNRRVRLHALAVATTLALASLAAVSAPAADRIDLSGLQASELHDRFIVKYVDGSAEHAQAAARDAALRSAAVAVPQARNARGATPLALRHERRMAVGAEVVRSSRKLDRIEAESLMRQIASNPNVEYVEVDKLNKAVLTPNDTNFSQQWGFGTTPAGIRATQAWDVTTGTGAVVAVLDTGITNHSDLNANILPGYDFIIDTAVAGDGNGRDSDASDPGDYSGGYASSWHGTHVAGTVAAVTNNAKGVAGTAFGAKVVPVRVLGRGGGYDSDIADAVIWASGGTVSGVPANANPAEVINLSLGGTGSCGSAMQSAINGAVGRGTTLVIAAGNSNANTSGFSPANCNNVIAVGSITSTGARSSFSNYGALVDIAAPGSSIMSTLNSGSQGPGSESYASYSGTSMAAPHVAGVVALIQSVSNPAKTPAQIEALIKSTASAFPSTPSQTIGAGIVNAKAAVDAAGGGTGNVAPTANFSVSTSGLVASFTDSSTDSDGSIASRSWTFGDGTSSTATSPSKTYAAAGTYSVTLTVTDNSGASNSRTQSVTVSSGGGGGSVLQNGVPVSGIAGAASSTQSWTINVPAGASNLTIASSGGTGDADLYVRFGSAPTTTTYDCRPYRAGNAESCSFAAPQAGTYHVMLRGYSAFSGVTLTGSYTAGGGGGSPQTYSNGTDYPVNSNATVESPITVSGRSGNAPASTPVAVNIVHTYRGDLKVDLVAPDGSVYVLHNRSGGSADNINSTYNVNLSSEALNGTWKLRVNDNAAGDSGYINSWSVTF